MLGTDPAACRIFPARASAAGAAAADQRPRARSGPGISPAWRARDSCHRSSPR